MQMPALSDGLIYVEQNMSAEEANAQAAILRKVISDRHRAAVDEVVC